MLQIFSVFAIHNTVFTSYLSWWTSFIFTLLQSRVENFRIIVADDDEDDFHTLQEAFLEIDPKHVLDHVTDGQKLLKFLENCVQKEQPLPHLVLLDINMPRMDGFEALDVIRKSARFSNIPVVMYSTCSDMTQMQKCYRLGADGFVTKGYSYKIVMAFASGILKYLAGNQRPPGSAAAYNKSMPAGLK
jgi:CheY-like chemotaxis protein